MGCHFLDNGGGWLPDRWQKCPLDHRRPERYRGGIVARGRQFGQVAQNQHVIRDLGRTCQLGVGHFPHHNFLLYGLARACRRLLWGAAQRSEEHTSELQSLMRISYAVFCLKKKTSNILHTNDYTRLDSPRNTCPYLI